MSMRQSSRASGSKWIFGAVAGLAAGLGLFVSTAGAQGSAAGRALFIANGCYQCHGYEGQGGAAVRIAPSPYPLEAFVQLVRRPAMEMPAYSTNVLSDEDLRSIYEYVRAIPEPPSVADIPALQND